MDWMRSSPASHRFCPTWLSVRSPGSRVLFGRHPGAQLLKLHTRPEKFAELIRNRHESTLKVLTGIPILNIILSSHRRSSSGDLTRDRLSFPLMRPEPGSKAMRNARMYVKPCHKHTPRCNMLPLPDYFPLFPFAPPGESSEATCRVDSGWVGTLVISKEAVVRHE